MRTLVLVLAALTLAACGGESDAAPPSTPAVVESSTAAAATPDPSAALEDAVQAYSVAFLAGDGAAAYELLSERCQDRTPLSEFAAVVEQAKEAYGPMDIMSLEVKVNGDQAQATYSYGDETLNQDSEPWANEDGWRNDDC